MNGRHFSFAELNSMADITKLQGMPKLPITVHSAKYGTEMHGPCPFCKTGVDRFMVNIDKSPMTFYCRQCKAHGNAMDYIAFRDGLPMSGNEMKIAEILSQEIGRGANTASRPYSADLPSPEKEKKNPVKPVPPNSVKWRNDLLRVVHRAAELIFEPEGKAGLDYLRSRGFSDKTVRKYHVGYIPRDLPYKSFTLKEGITIPTFVADDLYRVRIRCLSNFQKTKYIQVSQSDGCCLFNASDALFYPDILFVEGEFDAMIVNQELEKAGNKRIRAVTFGSAMSQPSVKTYFRYFRLPTRIIVSYDNDSAGASGANSLLTSINTIKNRTYPAIMKALPAQSNCDVNDWNDYYLNGGNIPGLLTGWFPVK